MTVPSDSGDWVLNAPKKGARDLTPAAVWRYRELAWMLAMRDLRARYKQAVLGFAWALLLPLATVVVFVVVFRDLAGVDAPGVPYLPFALAGTLVWTYLAGTITAATGSMVGNAGLLTKVYFPRLVGPVAALLPGLVAFGVGVLLLAAVLILRGPSPGASLLLAPLAVVWMVAAAFGPGLLLGAVNVRYRDVGAVQTALMQLWLLATPVAYPTTLVEERWRDLYSLNPALGPVEAFRATVLGTDFPLRAGAVSAASGTVVLALALWYFGRYERQFADVV